MKRWPATCSREIQIKHAPWISHACRLAGKRTLRDGAFVFGWPCFVSVSVPTYSIAISFNLVRDVRTTTTTAAASIITDSVLVVSFRTPSSACALNRQSACAIPLVGRCAGRILVAKDRQNKTSSARMIFIALAYETGAPHENTLTHQCTTMLLDSRQRLAKTELLGERGVMKTVNIAMNKKSFD